METCPKYSEADQKWRIEKEEWLGITIHQSKKDSDFAKLEREFRDNNKLSPSEKDILLKKIQLSIECDINLALMESQHNPNSKNHFKCISLINYAIGYWIDITNWKEKMDTLYSLSFLRDQSLLSFQKSIDTMIEYSKKQTWLAHVSVFREGYRFAKEYKNELQSLGVPEAEINKKLNSVLEKFIWIYLSDALEIAQSFMEWKSALRLFSSNSVTEWRRDFNDALSDYYGIKGNASEEYQKIVLAYSAILPAMLKIEAEIEIQRVKSEINNNWHDRPPVK
jgi:hypothetical protein